MPFGVFFVMLLQCVNEKTNAVTAVELPKSFLLNMLVFS